MSLDAARLEPATTTARAQMASVAPESARARRAHTLREIGGAADDPVWIRWRRLVSDTVMAMMLRLRYSNGKIATRSRQSVTELQSPRPAFRFPRRPQPPVPA